MTTENEWVKLPVPNPTTLPEGTRCRSLHGDVFRAETEIRISSCDSSHYVGDWLAEPHGPTYHNDFFSREGIECVQLPPGLRFEGSDVVKDEAKRSYCHKRHGGYTQLCDENCRDDDLGDTPEHLRPLLGDARRIAPGTLVSEETRHGVVWKVVWNPESTWPGWGSLTTLGNWNPNGGSFARYDHLKRAIQEGRCYPTADARRIGREEFGMAFDACFDSIDRAADSVTEAIAKALQVPLALLQPERDSRPKCVACEQPMDPRRDGDQTCSPECLQAHQRSERDREAREKFEASEKAYLDCRSRDRGAYTSVLEERIEQAQSQRRDLESNIARDIPRRRTYAAAALLKSTNLRPPGPGPKPLNPAALPGVCGVRGERKVAPPREWPEQVSNPNWED